MSSRAHPNRKRAGTSAWRPTRMLAPLATLAAGLGPVALAIHMANAGSSQDMSEEVIQTRIARYESFGWHRTGGAGDDLTSEWLRAEDALLEFRKRVLRTRRTMTVELFGSGELLRQSCDEALERMAELDRRREATWQAAAPEEGDAVPR